MKRRGMRKKLAFAALATVVLGSSSAYAAYSTIAGPKPNGTGVTPTEWNLTPAGTQLELGNKPFGAAVSPDHKYMVVSNDGTKKSLQVVDMQQQQVVSTVSTKAGLYIGVAFSPDGKTLYASGGTNKILVYSFANGTLTEQQPIVMDAKNTNFSPAGISVSADGNSLFVANNQANSVSKINLATGQVIATVPVGKDPYLAYLTRDGKNLYVTNWGESSVTVLDPNDMSVKTTINVGLHPNAIAENPVTGVLYVANSDSDDISFLDPATQKVTKTLSLAPYRGAQTGTQPNAMTVSADGKSLYVSNGGNNDLAVIDLDRTKVKGLIPTAWYPSGVFLGPDDRHLMVLNAKGLGAGPNTQNQYIGDLIHGTMSFIDIPNQDQLEKYTEQVNKNNRTQQAEGHWWNKLSDDHNSPVPQFASEKSPIKHVIYVIKENRTYDQVFGDIKKANGDPNLTEFGQQITPNLHKLANQFVTLDNFYEDSECSADGHDWSTAAKANDYKEKGFRAAGHVYDFQGRDQADYSQAGHIWNAAASAGVSFRNYGEFALKNPTNGLWEPTDKSMGNNYDPNYPGWDLKTHDLTRYDEWNKEFQQFVKNGNLPQLETMYLPNDHTSGTAKGNQTPQAMVAENDYALGKIVDTVSHSPYWKDTAIFVVEDDAQAGPDHVDAHRTEALVISPYTQKGTVDSTFYDTTSMLRTMEMILGIKPMSQFDAVATPMLNSFTKHPNNNTYQVEEPQYPITTMNGDPAPALAAPKLDFSAPDSADAKELNQQIWQATKGDKPYPGK